MWNRCRHRRRWWLLLLWRRMSSSWEDLPDVVLDILLGRSLATEDLRSFHQVCKKWAQAVESRPHINAKRRDFIKTILADKENKEQNVILDLRTNSTKSIDTKGSDPKTGSRAIISRRVLSSASSNASSQSSQSQSTPKTSSNRSTPRSRYQIQYEAARKLKEGEVLSPCPECRSPVPSPSSRQHRARMNGLLDLREETAETSTSDSNVISNNKISQFNSQCPTCSYRFCSYCKFKEHPGKPCREIDGESAYINESDSLRSCKSHNMKNRKILIKRKKNTTLRRIANL